MTNSFEIRNKFSGLIRFASVMFGIVIVVTAIRIIVELSYSWYDSGLPAGLFMGGIFVVFCSIFYYFEYRACSKYNQR